MVKDDLGMRMKTFYEQIPKARLMRRTPVIIQIDGKVFHTFTKGFAKPFDEISLALVDYVIIHCASDRIQKRIE